MKLETHNGDNIHMAGRFGHSSIIYRNSMIVFGGGSEYNKMIKNRPCFNEIWTLNINTFEWK